MVFPASQKRAVARLLRSRHDMEAKGMSKSCWKPVKSDHQRRSRMFSSIACKTFLPAETPMGTLGSGLYELMLRLLFFFWFD